MNAEPNKASASGSGNGKPALILACSGAADVGEISDHVARHLSEEGCAKMYCLAGVGGRISGMIDTVGSADSLVVIDGCSNSCGKRALENSGITDFLHVPLHDLGLVKGRTSPDDAIIARVAAQVRRLFIANRKDAGE